MVCFYKIVFLFCFIPVLLFAQFENIHFDNIGPIAVPNCILQDSNGFIWIGAQEGLLRYDGYKFKRHTFIPYDSSSLSNNWVLTIKEDKNGNLWIGTNGGGINYFDQKTEKFTRYMHNEHKSNTLITNNIRCIQLNDDGSLWLGTQNHGLVHMRIDSTGKCFYVNYSLDSETELQPRSGENFVLDIHKDRGGNLWIGTITGGLKLLNPISGELKHYKYDPHNPASISSNTVSSICEDNFGNIWIGTGSSIWRHGRGLNKYDIKTKRFTHYQHDPKDQFSFPTDNINSMLIDQQNILWIGTVDKGLISISLNEILTNKKPNFTRYSNFNPGRINSIYEDRIGNIWITSVGRTVYKYNRRQNPFVWYRHIKGNSNSLYTSATMVQVDKSGNIWFGGNGLDRYDPSSGNFIHYNHDPGNPSGLNSNRVTSICEDKYGYYWIGTFNGLNRLNPNSGTFDYIQENPQSTYGLKSNAITEVLASRSGGLWVASIASGLQYYDIDENRFYHFDFDTTSIEDEGIMGIYEDHSGTLWSQTHNYGFYSLKINNHQIVSVKHYIHDPRKRNSLSYNLISDIIRPSIIDTTALWIATGNGLNRFDLNTDVFTHFYINDGLPSNMVLKVLEDDEGNIWCTCAEGIAVYNIKSGVIKSYDKGDGMPITGFASTAQNACKTPEGQLIFGADLGALGFYPEQLKINSLIPSVRFTDFKVFQNSVQLDSAVQFKKKIILSYNQNMISFEFSALSFTNSQQNQYKYKMDGLYDKWIHIDHQRTVSFTNLDPGHYIFRVKGSNNHGICNEEDSSINIVIIPAFWQTIWFRILFAIIFLVILISIVRYVVTNKLKQRLREMEYQRKMDKERERISRDMHDEVGSSLTHIAILGEIAKKQVIEGSDGKKQIENIANISRNLVDNIGEIIWAINPRNDSLENLMAYTRHFVSGFFEDTSINCIIDFQANVPEVFLSSDFRRNIFLVIKEAVTNIVKHSAATSVTFRIKIRENRLKIEIKDNGKGFDLIKYSKFGNGLSNMQNRIQQLGGQCKIYSAPNNGTKITLAANIENELKRTTNC